MLWAKQHVPHNRRNAFPHFWLPLGRARSLCWRRASLGWGFVGGKPLLVASPCWRPTFIWDKRLAGAEPGESQMPWSRSLGSNVFNVDMLATRRRNRPHERLSCFPPWSVGTSSWSTRRTAPPGNRPSRRIASYTSCSLGVRVMLAHFPQVSVEFSRDLRGRLFGGAPGDGRAWRRGGGWAMIDPSRVHTGRQCPAWGGALG